MHHRLCFRALVLSGFRNWPNFLAKVVKEEDKLKANSSFPFFPFPLFPLFTLRLPGPAIPQRAKQTPENKFLRVGGRVFVRTVGPSPAGAVNRDLIHESKCGIGTFEDLRQNRRAFIWGVGFRAPGRIDAHRPERTAMHVVVCVKMVPDTTQVKIDPVTNTLVRKDVPFITNPFDTRAVEEALRVKDKYGARVTARFDGAAVGRGCLAAGHCRWESMTRCC